MFPHLPDKQRADSAARAAAGASTPPPPPNEGFSSSPSSPPTPPPLPPESADTGTMFGPAEGSFEAIFSNEAAKDTFIEHEHGVNPADMDTMTPQFSDKEIDSPHPDG